MIINPYNVFEIKQENIKEEKKDRLVENSIDFLINNYKQLIDNKKTGEIKRILEKYFISQKIKLNNINADIVISAIGEKDIITADMIKDGAVVIDAGCTLEDGELCGDVEYDKVAKKASLITPSKGGVGPMTVAMFLKNIILCYNNKK